MHKRINEALIVIDLTLNICFTSPVGILAHPQYFTEKWQANFNELDWSDITLTALTTHLKEEITQSKLCDI